MALERQLIADSRRVRIFVRKTESRKIVLMKSCSIDDICIRAAGYNMQGVAVDGNDVLQVREVALQAVERARKGEGPSLIENKTYRIQEELFDDLKASVKRVAAKDVPVPFSPSLEDYVLPKVSDVVAAAREVAFR